MLTGKGGRILAAGEGGQEERGLRLCDRHPGSLTALGRVSSPLVPRFRDFGLMETFRLERVKKLILPDAISFCYRPTDG